MINIFSDFIFSISDLFRISSLEFRVYSLEVRRVEKE